MARHYGIITNFSSPSLERAAIDISTEGPVNARFAVFTGGAPTYTNVQVSDASAQFVTSATSSIPNLATTAAGQPAIVLAETCDGGAPPSLVDTYSMAVLKQLSGGISVMELPRESQGVGQMFSFPLGDLFQGATLFLGAIDCDTTVNLALGGGAPTAIAVPQFTVVKQALQTPRTRVNLVSFPKGSAPGRDGDPPARIVALLALRTLVIDETYLLPTPQLVPLPGPGNIG